MEPLGAPGSSWGLGGARALPQALHPSPVECLKILSWKCIVFGSEKGQILCKISNFYFNLDFGVAHDAPFSLDFPLFPLPSSKFAMCRLAQDGHPSLHMANLEEGRGKRGKSKNVDATKLCIILHEVKSGVLFLFPFLFFFFFSSFFFLLLPSFSSSLLSSRKNRLGTASEPLGLPGDLVEFLGLSFLGNPMEPQGAPGNPREPQGAPWSPWELLGARGGSEALAPYPKPYIQAL